MTQEPLKRLLIYTIHTASIKLAQTNSAPHDPAWMLAEKPTRDEIEALAKRQPIVPGTDTDDLWSAAAVSPHGKRYWGLGRTPGEAKALAWARTHLPDGATSGSVEVHSKIPEGWMFELYPPPISNICHP